MAFRGERRGRYSVAGSVSKSSAEPERAVLDRNLTSDELKQLCIPISNIFTAKTCYDAMGNSTQVVVVEVHSPLTIAFIAAQETKVPQCVLWNAAAKEFAGVLPTTEYIKILLYCHDHPESKEHVMQMTISDWLAKTERPGSRPSVVVASSTEETLHTCFERMIRHNVRRTLLVAPKEANDMSLTGVLTQDNILKFITNELFAMDSDAAMLGSSDNDSSAILPAPVMNIVYGGSDAVDANGGNTAVVAVGPYRDILDVPFNQIPGLGVHRSSGATIKAHMSTMVKDALRMLIDEKIHSVAVVDDSDIVIDVVSRNDVMRMETNGMYDVTISVAEAISFHVGGNIFVFHETDTVRDILIHFTQSKVRELYLVDPPTDKLLGQLSMSEFLKFLFSGSPCQPETH